MVRESVDGNDERGGGTTTTSQQRGRQMRRVRRRGEEGEGGGGPERGRLRERAGVAAPSSQTPAGSGEAVTKQVAKARVVPCIAKAAQTR